MREVSPKELQELNSKSFKNTQEIFRRLLREIAADGEKKVKYNENDYCAGDYIAGWLRNLGFTVKRVGPSDWYEITWPKEEYIGEWIFDPHPYDYICSECGKHSEYTSPYCPNCGKKLKSIEGRKYDTE
jgi:hypothetical protein